MNPNPSQREFQASGSDYERGFQQGSAFFSIKNSVLQAVRDVPVLPAWLRKLIPLAFYRRFFTSQGKKFLPLHQPILKNYQRTNLVERFQGIADGFRESLPFIYGLNAFEIISSELPFTMGCTSLALPAANTADGVPLLAYNHDFPTPFGNYLAVRRNFPQGRYVSLNLTYPSIAGAIAGVNEKGLAVSLNHAFATDITPIPALLITVLVQECLDRCANVGEALALIQSTPTPNGSMITLLDKTGESAAVELSCTRKSVRRPKQGVLHTFNWYQQPEMREVEIPREAQGRSFIKGLSIHGHNKTRHDRFDAIFKPTHRYTEEDIRALLADHGEGEGSIYTICRHHPHTAETLSSSLINPTAGTMKVIFGFPCRGEYREFRLESVAPAQSLSA